MAQFQASRIETCQSGVPHLEASYLHAQAHLLETSPNQSPRRFQTSLTYTPDPFKLPQYQIPQACQTVNVGYSKLIIFCVLGHHICLSIKKLVGPPVRRPGILLLISKQPSPMSSGIPVCHLFHMR